MWCDYKLEESLLQYCDVILNVLFYKKKDYSAPVIDIVEKLGASPCPCPLLFCASGLNNIGG